MNYVDTHAHLYKEYYPNDFHEVLHRAVDAKVTQVILPCVNSQSIPDIMEAVSQYPDHLFPLIGIHPSDITSDYKQELSFLQGFLNNPEVVGVGEVGMDLYHNREFLKEQENAFDTQLQWALEYQFPLSIHIRNAYDEAFSILKQYKNRGLKGVLHCFSGGIQEARWAIDFGFKLGIGGVVTFKKNKLEAIVKEIGLEHVVLETDAPFLAPDPFRGKQNESAYIPLIAERIASIFEIPAEEVMRVTTLNAWSVFERLRH